MRTQSALHAFAIENSVVNGGSLTPQKSQFGQNQRDSYMGFTSRLNKEQADLILYGMNSGSSIKIKCMENQEIRIENNKYSSDSIFMRAET
jgi:hypothetical protein